AFVWLQFVLAQPHGVVIQVIPQAALAEDRVHLVERALVPCDEVIGPGGPQVPIADSAGPAPQGDVGEVGVPGAGPDADPVVGGKPDRRGTVGYPFLLALPGHARPPGWSRRTCGGAGLT